MKIVLVFDIRYIDWSTFRLKKTNKLITHLVSTYLQAALVTDSIDNKLTFYSKVFYSSFEEDPRLKQIEQYKKENKNTCQYLAEIVAAKVELIEKTPFDKEEQNLIINKIFYQLAHLYTLINPFIFYYT